MKKELKRFIDMFVPVTTCSLHCHYCYVFHQGLFRNKLPEFKYSPEVVKKALTQKRLGGVCLFNLCAGGETLLHPQITYYIQGILENGHYVTVVTNGTISKRFDELSQLSVDLLSHLHFKFSYHYLELKRRNILNQFFSNIRKMRDVGCSFTLELTPNDESIPYIEEIKQRAIDELGAACHVTIARNDIAPARDKPMLTNLSKEKFYETWGCFDSDMLNFKKSIFGVKRKEFCYAGAWSAYLNLGTGIMSQCYCSFKYQQIFDDPEKPINFTPVGYQCSMPHCYNGHAFLTLGCIPEMNTITYAQLRNRVCADGSEWLKPNIKALFSCKLKDQNREYNTLEKIIHTLKYSSFSRRCKTKLRALLKR